MHAGTSDPSVGPDDADGSSTGGQPSAGIAGSGFATNADVGSSGPRLQVTAFAGTQRRLGRIVGFIALRAGPPVFALLAASCVSLGLGSVGSLVAGLLFTAVIAIVVGGALTAAWRATLPALRLSHRGIEASDSRGHVVLPWPEVELAGVRNGALLVWLGYGSARLDKRSFARRWDSAQDAVVLVRLADIAASRGEVERALAEWSSAADVSAPAERIAVGSGGYVFLSYSRSDLGYVEQLIDYLTEHEVPVWFDHKIDYGSQWERVICARIDACSAMVVVMTPRAEESSWVAREITRADDARKPIFPLLLSGPVFFRLSHLQNEPVTEGQLPSEAFAAQLRGLVVGGAATQSQTAGRPRPARARVRPGSAARRHPRRASPWRAVRRTVAGLSVLALLLGAATAMYLYNQYWVGFDGDRVAVFHGWAGRIAVVAAGSEVVRTQVPADLRGFLEAGIPVSSGQDGVRLISALPGIYEPVDVPEGYDDHGDLVSAQTCLGDVHDGPMDTSYGVSLRVDVAACSDKHMAEVLAVIRTPFDRYPGDDVMKKVTLHICGVRIGTMRGQDPLWAAAPAYIGAFWHSGAAWRNGNRAVVCYLTGLAWTMRGAFPQIVFESPSKPRDFQYWGGDGVSFSDKNTMELTWDPGMKAAAYFGTTAPFPGGDLLIDASFHSIKGRYGFGVRCRTASDNSYMFDVGPDGLRIVKYMGSGEKVLKSVPLKGAVTGDQFISATCSHLATRGSVKLDVNLYGESEGSTFLSAEDSSTPLQAGDMDVFIWSLDQSLQASAAVTFNCTLATGGLSAGVQ